MDGPASSELRRMVVHLLKVMAQIRPCFHSVILNSLHHLLTQRTSIQSKVKTKCDDSPHILIN